jgi:hypothetical protein
MWVYMLASSVHVLANPKSHSFSTGGDSADSSVLSSFKSRCATQCAWQYSTAPMNCLKK